jgi:hypothetical protein
MPLSRCPWGVVPRTRDSRGQAELSPFRWVGCRHVGERPCNLKSLVFAIRRQEGAGKLGRMGANGRCSAASTALLVVLSLGLGGCTGGAATAPRARDNAGAPPPSAVRSPDAKGVADAVAAYRAMWKDLEAAGRSADPNAPQLGDHATGGALRLLKYGLTKDRQEAVVAKGYVVLSPQVKSATPATAPTQVGIMDCSDDSHWLQYKKTGRLKDQVPGGHHLTDATVQLQNGSWKVSDFYLHEVGTC